jgi:hypothetical protein
LDRNETFSGKVKRDRISSMLEYWRQYSSILSMCSNVHFVSQGETKNQLHLNKMFICPNIEMSKNKHLFVQTMVFYFLGACWARCSTAAATRPKTNVLSCWALTKSLSVLPFSISAAKSRSM